MYYYVSQVDASITTAHNEMMGSGIRVVSYEGAMVLSRILRQFIDDQKRLEETEGEVYALLDFALDTMTKLAQDSRMSYYDLMGYLRGVRDTLKEAKELIKRG
jgi:hypothetical protein